MSVSGKRFNIKNSIINPNLSDGLIFHVDSDYSNIEETNYLYDYGLTQSKYRKISNLVSDNSYHYSDLGVYTQTNNLYNSFSASTTYSFHVESNKYAQSFVSEVDGYSYFETGTNSSFRLYDYQDIAEWELDDTVNGNSYSLFFNQPGIDVDHKSQRIYHDNDLNRLFVPASIIGGINNPNDELSNREIFLLVIDTNINKIIGTVSLGVYDVLDVVLNFINIDSFLYLYISYTTSPTSFFFLINKDTLSSSIISQDFGPFFNMRPFLFNNRRYILCTRELLLNSGVNHNIISISDDNQSATFMTFSIPESWNGHGLTHSPELNNNINGYWGGVNETYMSYFPDVDVWQPTTYNPNFMGVTGVGGASWSRLYVPALSNSNNTSFLFIYGLTESNGEISLIYPSVHQFDDYFIYGVSKVPDTINNYWSNPLPNYNRDKLYMFGKSVEIANWIVSTYSSTASNSNYIFGVSQSVFSNSVFKSGLIYTIDFYTGTGIDSSTYSGYWRWDSDVPTINVVSNPARGQFTTQINTFNENSFIGIHRASLVDFNDNISATFSSFNNILSDFDSGKPLSIRISSIPNKLWVIRKNDVSVSGIIASFSQPYTDYISTPKDTFSPYVYRYIGRRNELHFTNYFPQNNSIIRNIQGTNPDNVLNLSFTGLWNDIFYNNSIPFRSWILSNTNDIIYSFFRFNLSNPNTNKSVYYSIIPINNFGQFPEYYSDGWKLIEINSDTSTHVNALSNTFNLANRYVDNGYIRLPNFGWTGLESGLMSKRSDRLNPIWNEGTISVWFYNKNVIGTSSSFESIFSCWEPIKKNQGTTATTNRTLIQFSQGTEFFFGLGNFNGNGSTITVKSRTVTSHYRPLINGEFNFTSNWYNITVSRSQSGLKVYLNGERLTLFSGNAENEHSTNGFINVSGVNEKNSFFLNRRDSRVVIGGYRQISNQVSNILTQSGQIIRNYDNIPIGLFNGYFKKIMIWRRELSESEVLSNFNSLKTRFI